MSDWNPVVRGLGVGGLVALIALFACGVQDEGPSVPPIDGWHTGGKTGTRIIVPDAAVYDGQGGGQGDQGGQGGQGQAGQGGQGQGGEGGQGQGGEPGQQGGQGGEGQGGQGQGGQGAGGQGQGGQGGQGQGGAGGQGQGGQGQGGAGGQGQGGQGGQGQGGAGGQGEGGQGGGLIGFTTVGIQVVSPSPVYNYPLMPAIVGTDTPFVPEVLITISGDADWPVPQAVTVVIVEDTAVQDMVGAGQLQVIETTETVVGHETQYQYRYGATPFDLGMASNGVHVILVYVDLDNGDTYIDGYYIEIVVGLEN